jgi:glutaminyl-tRNA synthetase
MTSDSTPAPVSNFLRTIIDQDLSAGRYAQKSWAGQPGPASTQEGAAVDAARIRTLGMPKASV